MAKTDKNRAGHELTMIQILDPKNLPSGKHYAIMIYAKETRNEYTDSYHPNQPGYYSSEEYIDIQHWVTTNEEIWKQRILDLERGETRIGKPKYSAFVVDKVAEVKLNVNVEVKV